MQEDNEHSANQGTTINEPRRSDKSNRGVPPERLTYLTNTNRIIEPKQWKALQQTENPQNKARWLEATNEEIKSLSKNQTWESVDLQLGKK